MNATKTTTAKGFTYTITDDAGHTLSTNAKADYKFAAAGTGNEYHPSGIWVRLSRTREAALKAHSKLGKGEILAF